MQEGSGVRLECSHDDTSLTLMFWYQQKPDESSLTLIAYGYQNLPKYEADFEKEFTLTRESLGSGTLVISRAKQSQSAVYFCAASTQ